MLRKTIVIAGIALAATSVLADPACFNPPPKVECKQPDDLGVQPSDRQVKAYNKAIKDYQACMQGYIKARQDSAASIQAIYSQELEAHAAAVKEFNAWVAKIKEQEKERESK